MKAKDWLIVLLFALVSVGAVTAVVLSLAHARAHHRVVYSRSQRQNLTSCYQNPGNGGC